MQTIKEFITAQQLTLTLTRVPVRTDGVMSDSSRHWLFVIEQQGRGNKAKLSGFFSQGSAHTKAPTLADILDCIASDASGIENAGKFSDWCGEYGYSADSREAEKIFHACEAQAESLKALLGRDAYQALLFDCERL
jgi:hypothetical protein